MNQKLLESSIFQLIGILLLGFLTLYLISRLFNGRIGIKYFNNLESKPDIFILCSGLFATGYLLSICVQPITNVIRILKSQNLQLFEFYLTTARYTGLFIFISLATFFLILVFSNFLHKLIENKIQKTNRYNTEDAPHVLLPVLIIVFSLLVKDNMLLVIESFIPYPAIPTFH